VTIGSVGFLLYASKEKWFVVDRSLVRNTFRSGLLSLIFYG
jgi:hypothetical protein